MFAVLMEAEGNTAAAFVTDDRHLAHVVYAEAEAREKANAEKHKVEPARYALMDCVTTPEKFYEIIEEGL